MVQRRILRLPAKDSCEVRVRIAGPSLSKVSPLSGGPGTLPWCGYNGLQFHGVGDCQHWSHHGRVRGTQPGPGESQFLTGFVNDITLSMLILPDILSLIKFICTLWSPTFMPPPLDILSIS